MVRNPDTRISLGDVFAFYAKNHISFLLLFVSAALLVSTYSFVSGRGGQYESSIELGQKGLGLVFETPQDLNELITRVYLPSACQKLKGSVECAPVNVSSVAGGAAVILRSDKSKAEKTFAADLHKAIADMIIAHHDNELFLVRKWASATVSSGTMELEALRGSSKPKDLEKIKSIRQSVEANQEQLNFLRPTRIVYIGKEYSKGVSISPVIIWGWSLLVAGIVSLAGVPILAVTRQLISNRALWVGSE